MRLLLLILLSAGLFGCSNNEECVDTPACGEKIEACCTPQQCHYSWKDRRFECNGIDCAVAADEVVAAACPVPPKSSIPDLLSAAAAEALAARRAAP